MSELNQILADIESVEASQALRSGWNPGQKGKIDIRIRADGSWYHEGRRIQREALVKLFAGILRCEENCFYLVTPVEKLAIEVEDAPFLATLVERIVEDGVTAIVFTTNIGERVIVDREHQVHIDIDADTDQPRPYVALRDGMDALISRSAFYDLLNLAEERQREDGVHLVIHSMGQEFELGNIDD